MAAHNQTTNIAFHEADIWLRFRMGDELALSELAQLYYRHLFYYGSKFSTDKDLVKDCIQDLFLELWERRAFLSDTGSVKFYLFKSLRRKIHREIKKRKKLPEAVEPEFAAQLPSDSTIEQLIIDNETSREYSRKLNLLLSRLSKRQQEVIHLRFFEKLSHEEIVQIMFISRQAVANLISRTLKEIRELWHSVKTFALLILFVSLS